jgi:hypothetical protein
MAICLSSQQGGIPELYTSRQDSIPKLPMHDVLNSKQKMLKTMHWVAHLVWGCMRCPGPPSLPFHLEIGVVAIIKHSTIA